MCFPLTLSEILKKIIKATDSSFFQRKGQLLYACTTQEERKLF